MGIQIASYENVTGKQRDPDLLAPVPALTHDRYFRKKSLKRFPAKPIKDDLFEAASGVSHVPGGLHMSLIHDEPCLRAKGYPQMLTRFDR